jgi:NAD(P)-dependent dehydrogenase (short-subunit alcohol dehydrogenase family)
VGGQAVLGAANSAVEALVRTLAVELSPLRVNAVAPGELGVDDEKENRTLADSLPARRIGEYADMARAVLFLIENQFMTGTVLRVDGGATAM